MPVGLSIFFLNSLCISTTSPARRYHSIYNYILLHFSHDLRKHVLSRVKGQHSSPSVTSSCPSSLDTRWADSPYPHDPYDFQSESSSSGSETLVSSSPVDAEFKSPELGKRIHPNPEYLDSSTEEDFESSISSTTTDSQSVTSVEADTEGSTSSTQTDAEFNLPENHQYPRPRFPWEFSGPLGPLGPPYL